VFAALAGVAAGFFHVLAGPDHLAAVAPLAVGAERTAWRSGLTWGLVHTAGVLAVGTLLLAFRELLPIDLLSAWSERLVGLALVGVGAWGIWEARRLRVHRHDTGAPHAHVFSGGGLDAGAHRHQHASVRLHGHARAGVSLGMGTLHGLAGSSHLFGILPALAFASRADAGWYLAGFGTGAIAAMTVFAALVGAASLASGRSHAAVVRQVLLLTTSGAAVLTGGVWLLA
jgi:hypothetical protein